MKQSQSNNGGSGGSFEGSGNGFKKRDNKATQKKSKGDRLNGGLNQ